MLEILKMPNTDVRVDEITSPWGTIHHLHVHLCCPLTGKEIWVKGIINLLDYEALLDFRAASESRRQQIREEVNEANRLKLKYVNTASESRRGV